MSAAVRSETLGSGSSGGSRLEEAPRRAASAWAALLPVFFCSMIKLVTRAWPAKESVEAGVGDLAAGTFPRSGGRGASDSDRGALMIGPRTAKRGAAVLLPLPAAGVAAGDVASCLVHSDAGAAVFLGPAVSVLPTAVAAAGVCAGLRLRDHNDTGPLPTRFTLETGSGPSGGSDSSSMEVLSLWVAAITIRGSGYQPPNASSAPS
jgi:hypothetical protein